MQKDNLRKTSSRDGNLGAASCSSSRGGNGTDGRAQRRVISESVNKRRGCRVGVRHNNVTRLYAAFSWLKKVSFKVVEKYNVSTKRNV